MQITTFPHELGWQGRSQRFKIFNELFKKEKAVYSLFVYTKTTIFEPEYTSLNKEKELVYVCKGNLDNLLDDLQIYHFQKNELRETKNQLKLHLTQKAFDRTSIIRQPEKVSIEGVFYSLTEEEFIAIPFDKFPITEKRNSMWTDNINDSAELTKKVKKHLSTTCTPLETTKEKTAKMKYIPIIVEDVKEYVPKCVNERAFELAVNHKLSNLEFNFLNYFYEKKKSLRNDVGQLFFDTKSKGIGWGHSRSWVKEKMKRLMELGLVKHETRHDCRDGRYTSWYFYDANEKLDKLKHDF